MPRLIVDLRRSGVPEVPMLGRYRYQRAEEALHDHAHRGCLEICFLAKGRQQYVVGGKTFRLRGGDLFVTFPGEVHSTGGAPQEKGVLYWLILGVPPEASPDGETFLGCDATESRALRGRLLRLPGRHFPGERGLQTHLERILSATGEREPAYRRLRLRTELVGFLLRVIALAGEENTRAPVSGPIQRVRRHVETRIAESLTLTELAAVGGLSLPRFKERFRAEMGLPPAEYVLRRKVKHARDRLLKHPAPTVTEVAFALGFSSSQYFATVFRRYTGVSPGEWQRVGREGESRPAPAASTRRRERLEKI